MDMARLKKNKSLAMYEFAPFGWEYVSDLIQIVTVVEGSCEDTNVKRHLTDDWIHLGIVEDGFVNASCKVAKYQEGLIQYS